MKHITELGLIGTDRPLRVLQFGEGNFLRAFADEMIDILNEKTDFNGSIAMVRPRAQGSMEQFSRQNNLYTVILRGKENGRQSCRSRVITSVKKTVDGTGYQQEMEELAGCPTLRFVISNTTEAGIVLDETDTPDGIPSSFPGKLAKFLFRRWTIFGGSPESGLIILPVELIENNGGKLKACVLRLADLWHLPEAFIAWLEESCLFCNTLVDRIVTGYPSAEAEELFAQIGYRDELLDVGEPFGLWVIESSRDIREEFPAHRAGLPVVFTDNLAPYRERKVRILNGAHTISVLAGWLYGLDIVRNMMQDPVTGEFVRRAVMEEIVPLVPLARADAESFAESVFERFENPFIDHELLAISLNSVSKWKTRVLPTLRDYYAQHGCLPRHIVFSFAALLAFYTADDLRPDGLYASRRDGVPYLVRDDRAVLEFFAGHSRLPAAEFVDAAASREDFWGEDLRKYPGFSAMVTEYLEDIRQDIGKAIANMR